MDEIHERYETGRRQDPRLSDAADDDVNRQWLVAHPKR
jgi:hypothetical protein